MKGHCWLFGCPTHFAFTGDPPPKKIYKKKKTRAATACFVIYFKFKIILLVNLNRII